jgi:hypothetical protein
MDSESEGEGGWPPESPRSSSSDATSATAATQSILPETTGCQQTKISSEFKQLAAYVVKEKAPKEIGGTLERIPDAYKRATTPATTDMIHSLQEAVQKLTAQIEAKATRINELGLETLYAVAAQQYSQLARTWHSFGTLKGIERS